MDFSTNASAKNGKSGTFAAFQAIQKERQKHLIKIHQQQALEKACRNGQSLQACGLRK
jgi:hypothetical protein